MGKSKRCCCECRGRTAPEKQQTQLVEELRWEKRQSIELKGSGAYQRTMEEGRTSNQQVPMQLCSAGGSSNSFVA